MKFQRRRKIGILGGGQLGMFLAKAAHNFGLQPVVYCQSRHEPAAQIVRYVVIGEWNDRGALEEFATSGIEWLLCEWENVPPEVVEFVGHFVAVDNMVEILSTGRSRCAEKTGSHPQHPNDWLVAILH